MLMGAPPLVARLPTEQPHVTAGGWYQTISQRDQIQVIRVGDVWRGSFVITDGPLKSADQPADQLEAHSRVRRPVEILRVLQGLKALLKVIERDLIPSVQRPVPFDRPSASGAGLVVSHFKILIKISGAGLCP
jgi:hypothetical protein